MLSFRPHHSWNMRIAAVLFALGGTKNPCPGLPSMVRNSTILPLLARNRIGAGGKCAAAKAGSPTNAAIPAKQDGFWLTRARVRIGSNFSEFYGLSGLRFVITGWGGYRGDD